MGVGEGGMGLHRRDPWRLMPESGAASVQHRRRQMGMTETHMICPLMIIFLLISGLMINIVKQCLLFGFSNCSSVYWNTAVSFREVLIAYAGGTYEK